MIPPHRKRVATTVKYLVPFRLTVAQFFCDAA